MYFNDRSDAGRQLCLRLKKFQNHNVVVYALPRGGVVVGAEVANFLHAPLDVVLARKIGHPYSPEYAIAAVSESGHLIENLKELASIDPQWLRQEKKHQEEEIKRRRSMYSKGKPGVLAQEKIAIIVDDGIATGLTMRVSIQELKGQNPKKVIVAVPVVPKTTAELISTMVDEFIALEIPEDSHFLGAVGAYYKEFFQVEDNEVVALLNPVQ